jgi:hypothetical protein
VLSKLNVQLRMPTLLQRSVGGEDAAQRQGSRGSEYAYSIEDAKTRRFMCKLIRRTGEAVEQRRLIDSL